MHPRNPHVGRYDFDRLCELCPDLVGFVEPNPKGDQTIDFSNPAAVLCLNQALLAQHYGVQHWMLPKGYLCPPIPGRADYIHHLADLLNSESSSVRVLDVGIGANCIYPIIGSQVYGWKFLGSEIDPVSVKAARAIVEANPCLQKQVRIVQQRDSQSIFKNVIKSSDRFAATMCNPPFHDSPETAQAGSKRKVRNLGKGHKSKEAAPLNFGGRQNELCCEGGELAFIHQMIKESVEYPEQVQWFTSLVSKSESLPPLKRHLQKIEANEVKVIPMKQGNKQSRLLAWRLI